MFDNVGLARVVVILLFAAAFIIIGTMAPVMYATYVPDSEIMETHSFTAQNASVGDESHYVCLDRTVNHATTAEAFTELFIVNGDTDQRVRVNPDVMHRYLEDGRAQITTEMELPDGLEPGKYQYLLVVEIDMANDRVQRNMAFRSDTFTITDEPVEQTPPEQLC